MVKGIRDGIDKQKLVKSLTEDDWKRISQQKELESGTIKDPDAVKCAVMSDQLYVEFDKLLGHIEGCLFSLLSLKSKYDQQRIEYSSGLITTTYPNTNNPLSKRDLEITSMLNLQRIGEELRNLRMMCAGLWGYVGRKRIDNKQFFFEAQYKDKMQFIKDQLKEAGLDLYKERI